MRVQAASSAKSGVWLMRVLGLGVLLWLFSQAEWAELAARLQQVDSAVLYFSPPLTIALFLLRALRWKLLLVQFEQGIQLSLWRAWSIYAIGFFLGVITPGRMGDMAKAAYVGQQPGLSVERALASTFFDRILDLALLACMLLWAILHLGLGSWWRANSPGWSFYAAALALLLLVTMAGWRLFDGAFGERFRTSKWGRLACGIAGEMGPLANRTGLQAVGITCAAYALYFSHTYLLAQLLGLGLSFADVVAMTVLIGLAAFLPISVAGLGTREGVLVLVMTYKEIPNALEAALTYAALFFIACYVFPALLGLLCWLRTPFSLADLRALKSGREEESSRGAGDAC